MTTASSADIFCLYFVFVFVIVIVVVVILVMDDDINYWKGFVCCFSTVRTCVDDDLL